MPLVTLNSREAQPLWERLTTAKWEGYENLVEWGGSARGRAAALPLGASHAKSWMKYNTAL